MNCRIVCAMSYNESQAAAERTTEYHMAHNEHSQALLNIKVEAEWDNLELSLDDRTGNKDFEIKIEEADLKTGCFEVVENEYAIQGCSDIAGKNLMAHMQIILASSMISRILNLCICIPASGFPDEFLHVRRWRVHQRGPIIY